MENIPGVTMQTEKTWAKNVYWMSSIILGKEWPNSRDETMKALSENGIETRPFFYPMHSLPIYQKMVVHQKFPVADKLSSRGINIPSSASLSTSDIDYICNQIAKLKPIKF